MGGRWNFPYRRLMERVGRAKQPLDPTEHVSTSNFMEDFSYRGTNAMGPHTGKGACLHIILVMT